MIRLMAVSLFMSVLLTGCTWGVMKGEDSMRDTVDNNHELVQEKEPVATKEFLMETFLLTEEEIEPYNVEELISYFELTEEFFLKEKESLNTLSDILKEFERLQNYMQTAIENENSDFSYLIEAEEYKGNYPELESIRYLTVSHQMGDGGTSFLMDFEKNIIYDSPQTNSVYENIQYAQQVVELTEEMKTEILQALKDAEVWKWKFKYSSKDESALENWWHLGLEFNDGTIISFSGAGAVPNNYKPLRDVLFKR